MCVCVLPGGWALRPPGNRAPEPDEMKTCGQFLDRQLDTIRPKAICVLGGTAAKYLLDEVSQLLNERAASS